MKKEGFQSESCSIVKNKHFTKEYLVRKTFFMKGTKYWTFYSKVGGFDGGGLKNPKEMWTSFVCSPLAQTIEVMNS